MKKILLLLLVSLLLSCTTELRESIDFTEVVNPNLSEESVVGQPNSSAILKVGLERQIAIVFNEILILAELGSDNYVNTQTFFNQFLDKLEIRTDDPDMDQAMFAISRLREIAIFGLQEVGPADEAYTKETEAEFHFFKGMSYLFAGMYFSNLPQEPSGITFSVNDNYNEAIKEFELANGLNEKPEYHLANARANYYLGNQTEAVGSATKAIALDDDFLRSAEFDQKNGPSNTFESALFERGTFDDLQPLPSLDFLDPKYSLITTAIDPSVHYLKAEEAYLILAEANLANTDVGSAQTNLTNLLGIISSREVRNIDDSAENRPEPQATLNTPRPNNTKVVVNGRTGLVLDRQAGNVDIPSVSGTSLTQNDINNMTNDDASLELLYRTRQEVFIAEGLRFVDMGVKLVIHQNEFLQNPNINDGDPGTIAVVPSFIDAVKDDLDGFTYDETSETATTTINLNEILVSNKTSSEVLPFH